MEMSALLLHSILVLLVVIQVTFACQCKPITLEQAMCSSKTVILARVISWKHIRLGENAHANLRYTIQVTTVFQVEPTPLSFDGGYSYMKFPQQTSDCGTTLLEDMDYVIVGNVDSNGVLVSDTCNHIVQYEYIAKDKHTTNILQGEANCKNV